MKHICKNCGTSYKGNYCNQCGQKSKVGKLTLRSVLDNWAYGLTNCDTGILFTYKELFTRPGHMLADYISGKRVIYFQPFPMLFITAGFYGLLTQILFPPLEKEVIPIDTLMTFQERCYYLATTWVHTSKAFTAIITLPVFAWAALCTFHTPRFHPFIPNRRQLLSAWIYQRLIRTKSNRLNQLSDYLFISTYLYRNKYLRHKKYNYNFTEYIFIFAYIACQHLVVAIFLATPVLLLTNSRELTGPWAESVYLVYFLLLAWDIKQLYNLKIRNALTKTILLLVNWCLVLFLAIVIIASLFTLISYICNITGILPNGFLDVIYENVN